MANSPAPADVEMRQNGERAQGGGGGINSTQQTVLPKGISTALAVTTERKLCSAVQRPNCALSVRSLSGSHCSLENLKIWE
jgi:hypothetical protein